MPNIKKDVEYKSPNTKKALGLERVRGMYGNNLPCQLTWSPREQVQFQMMSACPVPGSSGLTNATPQAR